MGGDRGPGPPKGVDVTGEELAQLHQLAEAHYWERVKKARWHFPTYAEMVVKDQDGTPIEYSAMHLAWVDHVEYCWSRRLHAMILAPFGSGKSSGFAVPLATFLVGRDVQIRIKFVSNGDDFAAQRVQAAQEIITGHEYADVFPHVVKGKKWNTRETFVRRKGASLDPTLHARGVETKGVGGRADRIIFDDVCDEVNTAEQRMRAKIKHRVQRTWMSRLDPVHGLALWIATPWHADDATYHMMAQEGWCTLIQRVSPGLDRFEQEVIGARDDYPGLAPLSPKRVGMEQLRG